MAKPHQYGHEIIAFGNDPVEKLEDRKRGFDKLSRRKRGKTAAGYKPKTDRMTLWLTEQPATKQPTHCF